MRLVQGVGINDRSVAATLNGKITKEYDIWHDMLKRCYSKSFHEKRPTYIGCSVSDTFKHYHMFHAWCQIQIGFGKEDYHLDKDLLLKGNKVYSEYTCIFIPRDLNNLLTKANSIRGILPIGVRKNRSKFRADCSINNTQIYIGTFDTPDLAFQAYKVFKEARIKELAELYKGSIDPRAYTALINYTVELDD